MNKISCSSLFINLPSRMLCIFLCIVFVIVFTPMSAFSYSKEQNLNTKQHKKSNEIDNSYKAPTPIPLAKDSEYKYYGQETKIFVKTDGDSFVDKTDDILKNGYVGHPGENTVLRIQLSGYKYKENNFTYRVVQCGGIRWGTWYLYQNATGRTGIASRNFKIPFKDSFARPGYEDNCYCRCAVPAEVSMGFTIHEKAKSIYQYCRTLNYYIKPDYSLLRNNTIVSGTESAGDITQNSTLSRTHNVRYDSVCYLLGRAYGYWSMIANSYESLKGTSRNNVVRNCMDDDANGFKISETYQWDTADKEAYNYLDCTNYPIADTPKYTVYRDIDLSTISDPSSSYGKYSISLDNGKVKSKEFALSFYDITDSSVTMQQAEKTGIVATDNACIKFYNGSDKAIGISTQEANATLGKNDLTLVDNGYFTPTNVENFGSKKAMSKIEAYIDDKNLKSLQKLSDVSASSVLEIPITIKNANAISQQLNGKINIPTTVNYGSKSKSIPISIDINSVVPQITVSVPISIYLYMAEDSSSVCVPDSEYFIVNKSSFPLSSKVCASIVKNDTTATDENDVPFFPKIDENSPFKLWIKSPKSEKIQFKSIDSSSKATDFRNFGTIGPRNSKLSFSLSKDGDLPDVANPGTYHYKIFFKFASSENDYN